jgi:hypothetical protein
MKMSKGEPEEEIGSGDILFEEIESWKYFRYALREENADKKECQHCLDLLESLFATNV